MRTPLAVEQWSEIETFPGYSVSDQGRVRNDETDRLLVLLRNNRNIINVGLFRDGVQHRRSVTVLVARAFLPPPELPYHQVTFDTPINLDGVRANNYVANLAWRPRWFAMKYHRQFGLHLPFEVMGPILHVGSKQVFNNPLSAAINFGLIASDILRSTRTGEEVWPGRHIFRDFDVIDIIPRQVRRI